MGRKVSLDSGESHKKNFSGEFSKNKKIIFNFAVFFHLSGCSYVLWKMTFDLQQRRFFNDQKIQKFSDIYYYATDNVQ